VYPVGSSDDGLADGERVPKPGSIQVSIGLPPLPVCAEAGDNNTGER